MSLSWECEYLKVPNPFKDALYKLKNIGLGIETNG